MNKELIMLMILDGFGISDNNEGNAIKLASTPNLDYLFNTYPNSKINASGEAVGLPDGQMGNSEVGHTNIGAGRIVYQDLVRINKSIEDKSFYDLKELNAAIDNCINNNTNLHIMGLVSDGGVHSHIDHLIALLDFCKSKKFDRVYVHVFTDGRDTNPKSGLEFVKKIDANIVSISGRYYAMDRDNRWDRVKLAYDAIVNAKGDNFNSAIEAIENSYNSDITDEFIKPVIINGGKEINNNDSIIFFNFRPDRARELTRAITDKSFNEFERKDISTYYLCMTVYDKTFNNVHILFKPEELKNTFGEYISDLGYRQLRIAETEKYAHVTFFFNGGKEDAYKNEDRILVPSPKVATYDMMPEMSANIVRDKVIEAIDSNKYDVIILNFANTDMVGHTGNLDATIKAVETIDTAVGMIYKKVLEHNGILLITADHGNAEKMIENNDIFTAHTTNLVPLIITKKGIKLNDGRLCDITPTMLDLMGLDKPIEMTGKSLIGDSND
jgi:2,3-bisphosphoglycerate-independent phosphoglycerate mutase